jgi:hypothetical protein
MYSIDGLENGIGGCRKNIAVLEAAIEKERNTIKEYRIMIDDIEQADKLKKNAQDNVHLEIVNGSSE